MNPDVERMDSSVLAIGNCNILALYTTWHMLGYSIQVWSKSFGVDLQERLHMWYHTGIAQLANNTNLFKLAYIS